MEALREWLWEDAFCACEVDMVRRGELGAAEREDVLWVRCGRSRSVGAA